jgi:hypothetical protein
MIKALLFIHGAMDERYDQRLMVGDRPEDQIAGIDFMWAHDWIKG